MDVLARVLRLGMVAGMVAMAWSPVAVEADDIPTTTRINIDRFGVASGFFSEYPSASAGGRFIAFETEDGSIVEGDSNGVNDIFVRDTVENASTRVSISSQGAQANGASRDAHITPDGRYVVFVSSATNLVVGDTNGVQDVFVRDLSEGTTIRIVGAGDAQPIAATFNPSISDDGRFVVFDTQATNLFAGDTNDASDVLIKDTVTGALNQVNVTPTGAPSQGGAWRPEISGDGTCVAFTANPPDLAKGDVIGSIHVYVRDLTTATTKRVSIPSSGTTIENGRSDYPSISRDGRYVAFTSYSTNLTSGDTNECQDIYVRDWVAGKTTRVSVSSSGAQSNARSEYAAISADGRFVAFQSEATNLVEGDSNGVTDVFCYDRGDASLTRASVGETGAQSDNHSTHAAVSPEGRHVAFYSMATNLVESGYSGAGAVFSRYLGTARALSAISLSTGSASSTGYRGPFVVAGHLAFGDTPAGGQRVVLQSAVPGGQYSDTSLAATTTADGAFKFTAKPKSKTYYRVRFEGSSDALAALSQSVSALPEASLARSTSWTTLYINKTYYAKGDIEPYHKTTDANKVTIRAYKKGSDGEWHYKKSFTASYSYHSSTRSHYKAAVKLTSKGSWKLVAYHATDSRNYKTYGSPDYVRVK